MISMQTGRSTSETVKALALVFALGLIAGPLVSDYVGLQLVSRAARTEIQMGVVEQQTLFLRRAHGPT